MKNARMNISYFRFIFFNLKIFGKIITPLTYRHIRSNVFAGGMSDFSSVVKASDFAFRMIRNKNCFTGQGAVDDSLAVEVAHTLNTNR